MILPIDGRVHRAFKASVGVHGEFDWDCARGRHEPVWVRFIGEFRCGGCFRKLGLQHGAYR